MLMTLVWTLAGPLVVLTQSLLPAAPAPVDLVLPWPAWLPFWPFGTTIAATVVCGLGAFAVRGIRWLYGLIPVVQ